MGFQMALDLVKKEVEQGLAAFFAKKRQEAKQISPHCLMLTGEVAEFTMRGGKRTRAFLCWLGYQVTGKEKIENKMLSAMMALELFQSFALIHDDIIDGDTIRRGEPTVHVELGVSMAILAGDLALVWADECMQRVESQKSKVKSVYQYMKEDVILGQSLDVLAKEGKPSADRVTINRYKTAWYSVIRPLQIGASLGGADEKMLDSFVPSGLAIGEAYQIRDDFLDHAITKSVFEDQACMLRDRAVRAIKTLHASEHTSTMLQDFARFALERQA